VLQLTTVTNFRVLDDAVICSFTLNSHEIWVGFVVTRVALLAKFSVSLKEIRGHIRPAQKV
jgi:hypothetical protein